MKEAPYDIPNFRKIRVLIDSDAACECDDQYAIVHAILTPKFIIKGITAAHYGHIIDKDSMNKSYEEILKLLKLTDMENSIPVGKGAGSALIDKKTPQISDGAELIVEEALRDDPRPLFVVCQGAITNLASAYLMNPHIANKLKVIWIGGGTYPSGEWEFNLANDVNAANVVFDSDITLWQVPRNIYSLMKVSFAELSEKVRPYGAIGKYLFDNMMRENHGVIQRFADNPVMLKKLSEANYPPGESWQLGDSPGVGLLLTDHEFHYDIIPAPCFNSDYSYFQRFDNPRKIRVYNWIDSRFILEDMFAKLKYYFG